PGSGASPAPRRRKSARADPSADPPPRPTPAGTPRARAPSAGGSDGDRARAPGAPSPVCAVRHRLPATSHRKCRGRRPGECPQTWGTRIMTPEAIALVKASYAGVTATPRQLAARFYQELFAVAPRLRPLFPTDLTLLQGHFEAALALVVRNLDEMDSLVPALRDLGAQHVLFALHRDPGADLGDEPVAEGLRGLDRTAADQEAVRIEEVDHLIDEEAEGMRLGAEDVERHRIAAVGQPANAHGRRRRVDPLQRVPGIAPEEMRQQRPPDRGQRADRLQVAGPAAVARRPQVLEAGDRAPGNQHVPDFPAEAVAAAHHAA